MPDRPKTGVQKIYICDPGDDRCVKPIEPPFLPGISVRHSPSCSDSLCNTVFQCDFGNWRITNENTLDRSKWIEGWIMTQLLTRGFVDCPEHPLSDMPGAPLKRGGGWWADAFRVPSGAAGAGGQARTFNSGSKLWALQWRHGGATNDLLLQAEAYAIEALRPLSSWGIITTLSVKAVYLTRAINGTGFPGAVMHLRIGITGPGVTNTYTLEGAQMPNSEWLWREYMPPTAYRTGGRWYEKVQHRPAAQVAAQPSQPRRRTV